MKNAESWLVRSFGIPWTAILPHASWVLHYLQGGLGVA